MFGPGGQRLLDEMPFDRVYRLRVESLRDLIARYDHELAALDREIITWLRDDKGYWAIRAIDEVGKTMAAIFVAEIGNVSRFATPDKRCCWAGLAPRHRESDTKVSRGRITKMGSTLVRWAAVEAVARLPRWRTNPRPVGADRGQDGDAFLRPRWGGMVGYGHDQAGSITFSDHAPEGGSCRSASSDPGRAGTVSPGPFGQAADLAIRDTAVSIGAVLGLLYLPSILAQAVTDPLRRHLQQIAPMTAGLAIQTRPTSARCPSPPGPALASSAWAVASLIIGGLLLRLRDV